MHCNTLTYAGLQLYRHIRRFYEDPENIVAFNKWMETRNGNRD